MNSSGSREATGRADRGNQSATIDSSTELAFRQSAHRWAGCFRATEVNLHTTIARDDHQELRTKAAQSSNLVPGRACGGCVACCKSLEIDWLDFKKDADVLCRHSTGCGCDIHDVRPAGCKTWFCLWRRIGELPDGMRPDRCGLLISMDRVALPCNPFEQVSIVIRAIGNPAALHSSLARAAIDMFAGEGSLPVHVVYGSRKKLVYPSREIADAVQQPTFVKNTHVRSEVQAWRVRLGLPTM